MSPAEDSRGVFVWFDPSTERLTLRDLDKDEKSAYLDSVISVSGLAEAEDPCVVDGCDSARDFEQILFPFKE